MLHHDDPVALFERATARAAEVLDPGPTRAAGRPTPCAEWSVQDLIDHMVGSTDYLLAATGGCASRSGPSPARRRLRRVRGCSPASPGRGRSERTCRSPLGFDWTVEQATAGTFMDNLIHTWDLATATGQDSALDTELVEACIAMFLPDMPERGRAGRLVGPEVGRRRAPPRIGCSARWAAGRDRPDIEESIRAFAHPGRRAMLRLVWDAERPASDLADAPGCPSRPPAST